MRGRTSNRKSLKGRRQHTARAPAFGTGGPKANSALDSTYCSLRFLGLARGTPPRTPSARAVRGVRLGFYARRYVGVKRFLCVTGDSTRKLSAAPIQAGNSARLPDRRPLVKLTLWGTNNLTALSPSLPRRTSALTGAASESSPPTAARVSASSGKRESGNPPCLRTSRARMPRTARSSRCSTPQSGLAGQVLRFVPEESQPALIYFNVPDTGNLLAFNSFEATETHWRPSVVSSVITVFKSPAARRRRRSNRTALCPPLLIGTPNIWGKTTHLMFGA
jgi:hypothetical protein